MCDKLGKYTTSAYQLSSQHGRYVNPSSSHSISLVARELLTTDEIRRISRPSQIVISRAHPAMMNAPDLSRWYFNRMCGLGDPEHNRKVREARERARPVLSARTVELVRKALEMTGQESQYRIPWIVFDRNQVKDFDEIIQTAEKSGVGAGWSNPCFEIWMYVYFGEMPVIRESYTCCDRFAEKFEKVTGQKYSKNDRDIYRKLVQYGDEKRAIQMAERCYKRCVEDGKQKPSEMWPACRVHRLVEEILQKIGSRDK